MEVKQSAFSSEVLEKIMKNNNVIEKLIQKLYFLKAFDGMDNQRMTIQLMTSNSRIEEFMFHSYDGMEDKELINLIVPELIKKYENIIEEYKNKVVFSIDDDNKITPQ